MPTTIHADHAVVIEALDTLAAMVTDTGPRPWQAHDEHGRDHSDEGWSVIAVKNSAGDDVCVTYGPGYEFDRSEPEANRDLIVQAVNTYDPMLTLVRHVADRHRPIVVTFPGGSTAVKCVACRCIAPCEEYAGVAAVVNVELSIP